MTFLSFYPAQADFPFSFDFSTKSHVSIEASLLHLLFTISHLFLLHSFQNSEIERMGAAALVGSTGLVAAATAMKMQTGTATSSSGEKGRRGRAMRAVRAGTPAER